MKAPNPIHFIDDENNFEIDEFQEADEEYWRQREYCKDDC